MDGRIGGVFELLGHVGAGGFGKKLFGAFDGAAHAFFAGGQDNFGSEDSKEGAAFKAHRFGHSKDEFVTASGGNEGEGDTGIAASRFDDRAAWFEGAGLFGSVDHGHADTVFDAAEGVVRFHFDGDSGMEALGEAVEAHERCVTDCEGDI